MSVDLAALRRSRKPERFVAQLIQRPGAGLPVAAASGVRGVMVDTTVYIHEVRGLLPPEAMGLLDGALRFHCSFCLAEIAAGLGKLHPGSALFGPAWAHYEALFASVPARRLFTPDAATLAQAGLVSGILARTQNFGRNQAKELFNDAVIYLTAAKLGLPLLTANRGDCDLIQQVAGQGAFIHYAAMTAPPAPVTP